MSTITVQTISNGSVSTSSTNVIRGSAKAWANWNGSGTVSVRASYNVSSVTRSGSQTFVVAFTTAMPSTNYSAVASGGLMSNNDIQSFATSVYLTSSVNVNGAKQVGQAGEEVTIYNVIVMA